jgi:heavy metal sensor kinase
MLLRRRLTLINTLLVAGIILLFGAVIYQLISTTLTAQIDRQLKTAAEELVDQLEAADPDGSRLLAVDQVNLAGRDRVQIWSRDNRLLRQSENLTQAAPLDVAGLGGGKPRYHRSEVDGQSLRVLSVPLQVGQRPAGTLMVGAELALVDLIQRYILTVMVWGLLAAVLLVGLSVWRSTYRALEPLEEVSDTAVQITKADDLAMRIPYRGPKNDEVGQLIQAFNQTLEQLEDLFNTQRQFISDVSHELRTPLTVIKGNLDVLREIECIDHESFDTINEEVNRLSRLVNDLLYLAQAESGQLPLEEQEVALDTLMLEVYQQALTLAGESIQVEIEALDQVLVQGDQDRLKQVLLNLVSNAVKYTPAGGEVRLKLWKDQRSAYFAVRDTGPGIKAEDLPHIFKRFYRTEKARTRSKDSGFGLGLAIAYWIVEHHRGEIKVDTEVGRGTTFTVRLPLADPREED